MQKALYSGNLVKALKEADGDQGTVYDEAQTGSCRILKDMISRYLREPVIGDPLEQRR